MRVASDPLRQTDDALELWAAWRRRADSLPRGYGRNLLEVLHGEGKEFERRKREGKIDERIPRYTRCPRCDASLKRKGKGERKVLRSQCVNCGWERPKFRPVFAATISGQGLRVDPDYPLEERVELAVKRLPGRYRQVVRRNYLNWKTQDQNARDMGVSDRTFRYWLKDAKLHLKRMLDL